MIRRFMPCALSGFLWTVCGCGNGVVEQLIAELSDGHGAVFADGRLDGRMTYGYDASHLHSALLGFFTANHEKFANGRLCWQSSEAMFFVPEGLLPEQKNRNADGGRRGEAK